MVTISLLSCRSILPLPLAEIEGVLMTRLLLPSLASSSVPPVAATAEEALGEVEQERPDAILLDLKMPLINGVGFLYRLRENPANQDIAVGVITGAPVLDDATVNDLRALNAQVWFKPLSIEDIQQVAQTLLTRRHA